MVSNNVLAVIAAVLALASSTASAGAVSREAGSALAKLLPEGYRTAAVIPCALEGTDTDRFVAALVDVADDRPERVARLLYLAWDGRWTVLDSIAISGSESRFDPQYLSGISVVKVGNANVLFVYTTWFGGGSGSLHSFQFFTVVAGRLKLMRAFEHDRMERGLLCLRNDRIYNAEVACSRGERKGNAYVYSCHLDTREYTSDGESIFEARRESLEVRTGNRYLGETYRNMSLRSLLRRGGHFPPRK